MSHYENVFLDTREKVSKSMINRTIIKLVPNIFYQSLPVGGPGSGTIIDDGLTSTNNHLVAGAEKINVTLWNNQVSVSTVAGSCAILNIGDAKVGVKGLRTAQFGDSDELSVGKRVCAIANPFGLAGDPSVTLGVASSVNPTIESECNLTEHLVQMDASINLGNSGGVFDMIGRIEDLVTQVHKRKVWLESDHFAFCNCHKHEFELKLSEAL